MPYIDQDKRVALRSRAPATPGELNYVISRLCDDFMLLNGGGVSYEGLNEVIGVLACVQQELYRRVVAPFEDMKMQDNGDVFNAVDEVGAKETDRPAMRRESLAYQLGMTDDPQVKETEHGQTKPRRGY